MANFELNVNLSLDRIEGDSDDDVQVLGEREEEVRMVGVVIALQPGERWIERESEEEFQVLGEREEEYL